MRPFPCLASLLASTLLLAVPVISSAQTALSANTDTPTATTPEPSANTSLSANSTLLIAPSDIPAPPPTAPASPPTPSVSSSAYPTPADDSWLLDLPSPISPTRSQLAPGQNGVDSGIHRESHLITSDANTRATGDTDTPEDQRLSDLAQQDHDFFQTLDTNPNTWPDAERDRRAQAINDAYVKYLEDNPSNLDALILYGKFLRRVGERDDAYAVFQRAYRINNKTAVVNQQLGNYLAEEGQYVPALGFFIQAIEADPNQPLYHYQLGELLNIYYNHYLDDKIYTEATLNAALTGEFAKAAALDPAEPGYAWRYAESYYDILDPDWNAALAAWDALALRTTSDVELQVIRLHRARVLIELGRFDQARALVNQPVLHALEASRQELIARLNNPTPPAAPASSAQIPSPSNTTASPAVPSSLTPNSTLTTPPSASSASTPAPLTTLPGSNSASPDTAPTLTLPPSPSPASPAPASTN